MKTSIRIISLLTLGSILLLAGCSGGDSTASQVADTPTDVSDSGNLESSPAEESPSFSLPEGADEIVEAEFTLDFSSTTFADGDTSVSSEGTFDGINIQIGEEVSITGTSIEDSGEKELALTGKLYPFITGIYTDRIIVGDFVSENDDFAVRRVAVDIDDHGSTDETQYDNLDRQAPFISVYLDNNSTGDIIYLQTNITQENYEKLLEVSKKNISGYFDEEYTVDDYDLKVVALYLGRIYDTLLEGGHDNVIDIYLQIWLREEE